MSVANPEGIQGDIALARAGQRRPVIASLVDWADPVTITIAVLSLAVLILIPDKTPIIFGQAKHALLENLPFMALAVCIAAAAKATGAETLIAKAAEGREGRMVLLFAVFGALSPFCSCGVIPVIASLLAAGIPLAPVMAFWMSSPLMDPNQFIITAGEIGLQFAVARAMAAIVMGLASGYVTMLLIRTVGLPNPLRFKIRITGENKYDPSVAHERKWRFWEDDARTRLFLVHGTATFWFLLRWLTLAFLIEGLMMAFIPPELIGSWLGSGDAANIPFAGMLGALFYVNAFAAIPLVSGLMKLGMSPGAGLTFLVAGSALSIPASMAVYVLVTRKVFLLHLGLSILGALLAGYLYATYVALIGPM